jgi:hypothetical protein
MSMAGNWRQRFSVRFNARITAMRCFSLALLVMSATAGFAETNDFKVKVTPYKDAKFSESIRAGKHPGRAYHFTADATPNQVLAFYESEFALQGFSPVNEKKGSGTAHAIWHNRLSKETVELTAAKERKDGVRVDILVSSARK